MDRRQASQLRAGQRVRWVLTDRPEAIVVDLHPEAPAYDRGRPVRIVWPDKTFCIAWTDDLLLVG